MGDDANSRAFVRQQPQILPCPRNHRRRLKQVSLCNCKPVQAEIFLFRLHSPFAEAVRDFGSEIADLTFEPFGRDFAHPRVEVATDPVEIDTDNLAFDAYIHSQIYNSFTETGILCFLRNSKSNSMSGLVRPARTSS